MQKTKTPPFFLVVKLVKWLLNIFFPLLFVILLSQRMTRVTIEIEQSRLTKRRFTELIARFLHAVVPCWYSRKNFNMQVGPMQWTWVNYLSHHQPISWIFFNEKETLITGSAHRLSQLRTHQLKQLHPLWISELWLLCDSRTKKNIVAFLTCFHFSRFFENSLEICWLQFFLIFKLGKEFNQTCSQNMQIEWMENYKASRQGSREWSVYFQNEFLFCCRFTKTSWKTVSGFSKILYKLHEFIKVQQVWFPGLYGYSQFLALLCQVAPLWWFEKCGLRRHRRNSSNI